MNGLSVVLTFVPFFVFLGVLMACSMPDTFIKPVQAAYLGLCMLLKQCYTSINTETKMPRKAKPKAAPKLDPKTAEKRDRFSRIFPPRVDKLVKSLEVLNNCSSKSSYDWTPDLVQRAWLEIAKSLAIGAKSFGLEFVIELDGVDIRDLDTSKKLPKKTKAKLPL